MKKKMIGSLCRVMIVLILALIFSLCFIPYGSASDLSDPATNKLRLIFAGNINDSSGNLINMTSTTLNFSIDKDSKADNSFLFNSTRLNTTSNISIYQYTYSFWIKYYNTSGIQQICHLDNGDALISKKIFTNNGFIYYGSNSSGSTNSTYQITDFDWHFVILSSNGTNTSLYVDDQYIHSNVQVQVVENQMLYFGTRRINSEYLKAYFDEFNVWNYPLSASDRTFLYTAYDNYSVSSGTNASYSVTNITVTVPDGPYYKVDSIIDLQARCYDELGFCSSSPVCNISIRRPDSVILVSNSPMTYALTYFNYTISSGLSSLKGRYHFTVYCTESGKYGFTDGTFIINDTGKEDSLSDSAMILMFFLLWAFLFFASVVLFSSAFDLILVPITMIIGIYCGFLIMDNSKMIAMMFIVMNVIYLAVFLLLKRQGYD